MPFTLVPEEPAAPASAAKRFSVVEEPQASASVPQSFAAGAGDAMLFGQGPEIAGFSEYSSNLGAPGSYERGKQQYIERMKAAQANPEAFQYGGYTGMVATAPMLGGATGAVLRPLAAPAVRGLAGALSKGGKLAEVMAEPAAVVHGSKHLELAMKYGGRAARAGAEYMRKNPEGARELLVDALKEKFPRAWTEAQREHAAAERAFTLAPESQPPPGSGVLSAEMRAALKRGKFRHDYSTGEWRDFLAPGE